MNAHTWVALSAAVLGVGGAALTAEAAGSPVDRSAKARLAADSSKKAVTKKATVNDRPGAAISKGKAAPMASSLKKAEPAAKAGAVKPAGKAAPIKSVNTGIAPKPVAKAAPSPAARPAPKAAAKPAASVAPKRVN